MESTPPILKQDEPEEKPASEDPQVTGNTGVSSKQDITQESTNDPSPPLALIPLRSAAFSKNNKQTQLERLEAKQFPIVLGRTNLSQWWYQSCDCQQYYCRHHCRPVAQNIGSLSKVMIQIDTKGTAHIVGKNPHLVTIITPERGNNNSNSNSDGRDNGDSSVKDDKKSTENKGEDCKKNEDGNKDEHLKPIVLRVGDILSIGRRDREPWMRFQIVEARAAINNASFPKVRISGSAAKSSPHIKTTDGEADVVPIEATQVAHSANNGKAKTPQDTAANASSYTQQKNSHHDAQLPEWITTTTTTNTATGKRNREPSSRNHIYGTTDTKQQQQHQAMVATLTRAAAAAGAAADADGRNKSKKHYRYNSYYNYYNQNNFDAETNTAQRKRRRHTTSSFSSFHHGLSSHHSSKSLIRSADDLFYNGTSRKGGRLTGHHDDHQIHLVFQDYETSARLLKAGTRQGRNKSNGVCKAIDEKNESNNLKTSDETNRPIIQRKHARTDRNFIGKPKDERTNNTSTNTLAIQCNTNVVCDEDDTQKQQSKCMGLLTKNYAAALLEVTAPSVEASVEVDDTAVDDTAVDETAVDETAIDNTSPQFVLPGDQDFKS